MAKQLNIKVDVDEGSSMKTLNSLEDKMESLKDSIGGVAVGSEEFNRLSQKISKTESEIKNLELGMEGLDMEQKSSEMGSFAAGMADTATGALALSSAMGITNESSEEMIESMVSGMAVAQTFRGGLDGIVSAQKLLRNSTIGATAATQLNTTSMKAGNVATKANSSLMMANVTAQKSATVATKGATFAQRALNAVMKANPIMLLVGAVTAAVGAFALFSDSSEDAEEKQERLNDEAKEVNKTLDAQTAALNRLNKIHNKRMGVIATQEELDIKRDLIKAQDTLTDLKRDDSDNTEAILAAQRKVNKLEIDLAEQKKKAKLAEFDREEKQRKARISEIKKELDENIGATEADAKRKKELQKELRDLDVDISAEMFETESVYEKERAALEKKLSNDVLQTRIDNENKLQSIKSNTSEDDDDDGELTEQERLDKRIETQRRWAVSKQTILTNMLREEKLTQQEFDDQMEILEFERLQKEKKALEQAGRNTVDVEKKIAEARLNIAKQTSNKKAEINKGFDNPNDEDKSELELAQERAQSIMENQRANLENGLITKKEFARRELEVDKWLAGEEKKIQRKKNMAKVQMASDAFGAIANLVKQTAGESEEAQRRAFKISKAFNMAQAIANTGLAVTAALTAGGNPVKLASGAQFVEAGIAATVGAAQVAKIASTNFQGSSSGGGSASGGGNINAPKPQTQPQGTPDINLFGNANEGSEGDASMFNTKDGTGPQQIQAVVQWSDIESVQSADNNIQNEMQL